ncbi:conserved hypothetical protein [Ricinus communis]|uniref:Uncharacterized protein n=1 Tax=Ricinus communis TaxID=3988 RepID=B9RIZ2_RICCO|nr:conserved hypothetical protein [Ricinus communis]
MGDGVGVCNGEGAIGIDGVGDKRGRVINNNRAGGGGSDNAMAPITLAHLALNHLFLVEIALARLSLGLRMYTHLILSY